jgi:hypothetical protein
MKSPPTLLENANCGAFVIAPLEPFAKGATTMTIYVIRAKRSNEILDATDRDASIPYWLGYGYPVEEQPDMTEAEQQVITALHGWLADHRDEGAHWVEDTIDDLMHVAELRERPLDAYKELLRTQWADAYT